MSKNATTLMSIIGNGAAAVFTVLVKSNMNAVSDHIDGLLAKAGSSSGSGGQTSPIQ